MEDYIFILIAIALSVFGAMNKQKKKREEAMRGMDENERPSRSVFEEIFEGDLFMTGGREDNLVPPPVVKRAPVPTKKEKMKAPTKMEAPAKMEHKPLMRESLRHSYSRPERKMKTLEVEKLSLEDEAKLSPKNLIMKDFSLRKAVLYSEIINRKY